MNPQAELHEVSIYSDITTPGAQDVFKNAGVTVLTNAQVPESKKYTSPNVQFGAAGGIRNGLGLDKGVVPPVAMAVPTPRHPGDDCGCRDHHRFIRRFG